MVKFVYQVNLTNEQKRQHNLNLIWTWALDSDGYPGRALSTFHMDCQYRGEEPTIACCLARAACLRAIDPDFHPITVQESLEAAEVFEQLATKLHEID